MPASDWRSVLGAFRLGDIEHLAMVRLFDRIEAADPDRVTAEGFAIDDFV